jgi:predicted nucleic acid-binding protein
MGDVTIQGARATTRPEPVKAYLDNCIVGAIAQGEPEEKVAIDELLKLWHGRKLDLVTSLSVTLEEIGRVPEEHRRAHEVAYTMLEKVPTIDEDVLSPGIITARPGTKGPIPVRHPDLGWLTSILRDEDDARHIHQAVGSESAYFVTTDRGILARAGEIEDKFPIKVRKPSTLVLELAG